jgi:hypothetical protein
MNRAFTTEEVLRINFDRVYKAPKSLIGLWAGMAFVHAPRVLVLVPTHQDALAALREAQYAIEKVDPNAISKVYRAVGHTEIELKYGNRIKFQASNQPGHGLSRDWLTLYAEDES